MDVPALLAAAEAELTAITAELLQIATNSANNATDTTAIAVGSKPDARGGAYALGHGDYVRRLRERQRELINEIIPSLQGNGGGASFRVNYARV